MKNTLLSLLLLYLIRSVSLLLVFVLMLWEYCIYAKHKGSRKRCFSTLFTDAPASISVSLKISDLIIIHELSVHPWESVISKAAARYLRTCCTSGNKCYSVTPHLRFRCRCRNWNPNCLWSRIECLARPSYSLLVDLTSYYLTDTHS